MYFIKELIGLEFFIKARIGFGLDNFGSDRILNIRQLSDYKRPIRSDAHLYFQFLYKGVKINLSLIMIKDFPTLARVLALS